jgi:hypothetical protein
MSKAAFFHYYAGGYHFAIPNGWNTTALFKLPAHLMYNFYKGEAKDAFLGSYSYVASQLTGSFDPITTSIYEQNSGKAVPTPIGAINPFQTEKRAPEVVPRRLQNLPPEQQYTSKTSQTARWFGGLWNASPVKVERLIKTFGANVAADALALIDAVVY